MTTVVYLLDFYSRWKDSCALGTSKDCNVRFALRKQGGENVGSEIATGLDRMSTVGESLDEYLMEVWQEGGDLRPRGQWF